MNFKSLKVVHIVMPATAGIQVCPRAANNTQTGFPFARE